MGKCWLDIWSDEANLQAFEDPDSKDEVPGAKGEIQLSDAIRYLILEEKIPFHSYEIKGLKSDAGDPEGYSKAFITAVMNRKDIREPLEKFLRDMIK